MVKKGIWASSYIPNFILWIATNVDQLLAQEQVFFSDSNRIAQPLLMEVNNSLENIPGIKESDIFPPKIQARLAVKYFT